MVALWLVISLVHVPLLWTGATFPHIASDEVQFVMTGENIRLGNGFVMRGQFNDSLPPLFPLFVAMVHSISETRAAFLVIACLLMCSAMFPVFYLARYMGLDILSARLLAAAAGLLPHTFYAGTYMTESLQYPLYLLVFYMAVKWCDTQEVKGALLLGVGLGAALLVKVQTSQLVSAFIIAVVIHVWRTWRVERAKAVRFARQALLCLGVTAGMEAIWVVYKHYVHQASAVGVYGTVLQEQGLPHLSAWLCSGYLADFLLAPGLITVVPLFYWFRQNRLSARAVFVASVLAVQLAATGILDGGLTGWLRERLFIYSLPIMTICAVGGIDTIKSERARLGRVLFGVVPFLLLMLLLVAYPFHVSSIIEVPWANALGSFNGADFNLFTKPRLAATASALVVAMSVLLMHPKCRARVGLSLFVLLFQGLGLLGSSIGLTQWAQVGMRDVGPVMRWLLDNGLEPGDRLLIAGRQSYFEAQRDWSKNEGRFLEWTWHFGLTEALVWRIESLGRYDVRMIPSPTSLLGIARDGDLFITTAAFDDLDLISFRYPLYLYRIPRGSLTNSITARYATYVPAEKFYTNVGEKTSSGLIKGSGSGQEGYMVYGPYLPLPAGSYRVSFDVSGAPDAQVSLDVASHNKPLERSSTSLGTLSPIDFSTTESSALEYRIIARSASDFVFRGVRIELRNRPASPLPVPLTAAAASNAPMPVELAGKKRTVLESCYIDTINDRPPARSTSIRQHDGLRVAGWAADVRSGAVPDTVYLEFVSSTHHGSFFLKADRTSRPDVASAFSKPALSNAGVISTAGREHIPPGVYQIKILQVAGSLVTECNANRYIEVR